MSGFFPSVSGLDWGKLADASVPLWPCVEAEESLSWASFGEVRWNAEGFRESQWSRLGRDQHQLLKSSLPCSENQNKLQSSVPDVGMNLSHTGLWSAPWEKPEGHLQVPAHMASKESLPTRHKLGMCIFVDLIDQRGQNCHMDTLCLRKVSWHRHYDLALGSTGIFSLIWLQQLCDYKSLCKQLCPLLVGFIRNLTLD